MGDLYNVQCILTLPPATLFKIVEQSEHGEAAKAARWGDKVRLCPRTPGQNSCSAYWPVVRSSKSGHPGKVDLCKVESV